MVRYGVFKRNFNAELVAPLTRRVANSWAKVFQSNLFGALEDEITTTITSLINDITATSPPRLKEQCKAQGDRAIASAQLAIKNITNKMNRTMSSRQKEISRSIEPNVKESMGDGYKLANGYSGIGSFAKKKACGFVYEHLGYRSLFVDRYSGARGFNQGARLR
jgi:RNA processing factor Prp31